MSLKKINRVKLMFKLLRKLRTINIKKINVLNNKMTMNNIPLHNHTELYEVQNPRSRALPPVIEKEKKNLHSH